MRRLVWPVLGVVLVAALAVGVLGQPSSPDTPERRSAEVADQIRCPTCAGLSVADSGTPLAESSRQEIDRRVAAGESNEEIRQYFVSRYGEQALLSPRREGFSSLVWTLPIALGLAALVASYFSLQRWRKRSSTAPVPTDEERALVEAALRENQ